MAEITATVSNTAEVNNARTQSELLLAAQRAALLRGTK